jgi:hypothetical protein
MKLVFRLLTLVLLMTAVIARAEDLATPIIQPTIEPTAEPTIEVIEAQPTPAAMDNQSPSQAEGSKAPVSSRPTAVPKFSLPDVVITGVNELTIGAKRSEAVENDVSWGAQNLTDLNRSSDDLPGLNKSLTALSTQDGGAPTDTTLILHGGGGIPGTLGGWGLFGKDFSDMEYLISGYYSTWGGQATNGSFDGDQKYRFGGEFKYIPADDLQFRVSIYSSQVSDTLPYQNALQEIHQGLEVNANLNWKLSNAWRTELLFNHKSTTLNYWDQNPMSNQVLEYDGRFKLIGEEIDPFWNAFTLEVGDYQSTSNFSIAPFTQYNLAWANAQSRFNFSENLDLDLSLEGQSGSGPSLNSKLFPAVSARWRFVENTQATVYWKTARTLDRFFDTFMNMEHISPESELPVATENTGEFGAKLTHRLDENIVLNLTASTAQLQNYHQWTDINAVSPNFIETYSTLSAVQLNRFTADLEWRLDQVWKTNFKYQWSQGINNSGNNFNMTFLPQNTGIASITRADDQWESTLALVVVSDRQALDAATLDLPAYATINLSAAYHFDRSFSLWFKGDNLLGSSYVLEPGYLEPQFHLRGGIEIIF